MYKSLYQLTLSTFRVFFREPAILFWAVFFPIIMAWVLGIAFSDKGESTRTVYVVGADIPGELQGEKVFGAETGNPSRIQFQKASEEEAVSAIKKGLIAIYLEAEGDSIVYHFDPVNSDAQLTHLILERGLHEMPASETDTSSIEPLKTQGTRYIDFLVPGLIALGIMNSCIWGIGWTLIETRMKKLLRRMVATPMKKPIFFSSYVITRIVLGAFETVLLLAFARLYFDTEITGSIAAFVMVFLAGIFAFSGVAVLLASRTSKTEVANGLINAVTLPMMILSGIFFNYHNFPDWTLPIIQVLPLTLLADSIRAVFIEAAGIAEVAQATVILCLTGLATFAAGLKIFRWY